MNETLRLFLVYSSTCGFLLFLANRYVRPIRWQLMVALALLPMVSTGSAMWAGDFYGALNISYQTSPLAAEEGRLEAPADGYANGALMDQICQVVPWRKAIRELVKNGHAPLINRFSRGGDPLLAAGQPAPFDPKVWIGFLLPLATAVTFACAFVLFQAALFTFLYLRELEVTSWGAFFGASVFMLCGFLDFYLTWSLASVVVTLPLLLLGLRRLAFGHRHGFAITLLAWMLALLGGHPESVLHVTTIGGLFFLCHLSRAPAPRRAVGKAVAAGLLALALAAPVLLPFFELLPQTTDYWWRREHHPASSLPWDGVAASSLGALYPFAWGEPWSVGRPDLPARFNAASGTFVGALALAMAAVGLGYGPRRRLGFGCLAVTSFAVAMGLPGLADAVGSLPLFALSLSGRLVFVTAFALAVLAAFGFDAARQDPSRGRMALVVALGLVITAGGWWRLRVMHEAGLDVAGQLQAVPWLLGAPLLAALCGLLCRSPRRLAWLWLGLFLLSHRAELPRFYRAFDSQLFYPPLEELAGLPEQGEPYRVVGRNFDLIPGQAALWELEDMRGPSVLSNRRLSRLSRAWCKPLPAWFCRVDDLGSPLLDLFNVRFAVGDPATPEARDWPLYSRSERLAIYQNPDVMPRAFVPRHISVMRPSDAVAPRVLATTDFRRLAFIEDVGRPVGERRNGRATVTTRADGPDLYLTVEGAMGDGGQPAKELWVVVSQTFWHGWRAVAGNGHELELRPANHALLAVLVPPGTTDVRLHYLPRSWQIGWAVSGLAGLTLLGWLLVWQRYRLPSAAGEAVPAPALLGDSPPELSVVIPAYNEARRLAASLDRVLAYLEGSSFEVLVVDDGSVDGTSEVASRYGGVGVRVLRLDRNRGKGAALRHGVLHSRGRRVLLTDADLSIPIDQLTRLLPCLADAPVAVASRVEAGCEAVLDRPLHRKVMGRVFNRLLRLWGVVHGVGDTQCGFKLFEGEVARDLFARVVTRGFAFDVEILWLARHLGHAVREVGVRWHDHPQSSVRPLADPVIMLGEIARFQWHHRHLVR